MTQAFGMQLKNNNDFFLRKRMEKNGLQERVLDLSSVFIERIS